MYLEDLFEYDDDDELGATASVGGKVSLSSKAGLKAKGHAKSSGKKKVIHNRTSTPVRMAKTVKRKPRKKKVRKPSTNTKLQLVQLGLGPGVMKEWRHSQVPRLQRVQLGLGPGVMKELQKKHSLRLEFGPSFAHALSKLPISKGCPKAYRHLAANAGVGGSSGLKLLRHLNHMVQNQENRFHASVEHRRINKRNAFRRKVLGRLNKLMHIARRAS